MYRIYSKQTRRSFLSNVTGAGAAIALTPFASWALDDIDPRVAAIIAGMISIDSHNHIDVPLVTAEVPGSVIDLAGDMKLSGFSAVCMTFAVDYQKLPNPEDGYERFKNGLASMDQQLLNNNIKRSLTMKDLRAAHEKRQPTVIQSVEGGHFLNGKIERIEEAYKRGLRHITLLHDNDASVPLGDIYTNPAKWGGLTAFGAEVIKECNRLGIVVDLTHANPEMVTAAIKLSAHPVILSHTGLDSRLGQNENMARMMRPRLISKEQAKQVADAGGVIGVWTHLADSAEEYVLNIRALVDVAGIDHVCIGTDTKLTPSYRPGSFPGKPADAALQSGGNRPDGNGQNKLRVGERTNLVWNDQKLGFYYTVVDAMLKAGFTKEEIGKIGGGNFCRIFDVVTKGHN